MKKRFLLALIGGAAASGVVVTLLISNAITTPQFVTKTVEVIAPPPERIEVTRDVMVRALEEKLEITTFSMFLDTYVIAGVCDGNGWQQFAYRNCVTMLVPAKINAGFNWETFGPDSITTSRDEITVHLGKAKIHDVVINHRGIEVLNQEDGAFVSPDKHLQTKALAKAAAELRQKACRNDILKAAALAAEKKVGDNLRVLLKTAGDVRTVKIVYDIPKC